MKKQHGLSEEFKNNGIRSVLKRVSFYIPNHYVINKVKKSPLRYGLNQDEQRQEKIIISMTTYPKRFNNIYLCLKSLLLQSVKPDKIIIWLGSDTDPSFLTEAMKSLQEYGVEFRFDSDKNLMPHKKYFYALQEYPEDVIITVDDDVVYPENFVKSLIEYHQKFPQAVCARRVHKITFDANGRLQPYDKWVKECKSVIEPSQLLVAVGVGGVLYPPHSLDEKAFNVSDIKRLCLRTDDLWLKTMELLKDTPVVWVPCFFIHPPALTIEDSLWQGNVVGDQNDKCFSQLINEYNVSIAEK
ncbi:putative glycosyltransferase [Desulfosporosinus sp. BG]|nr:putative glycosyltransferase [Desulfosporosinus sp. BG]